MALVDRRVYRGCLPWWLVVDWLRYFHRLVRNATGPRGSRIPVGPRRVVGLWLGICLGLSFLALGSALSGCAIVTQEKVTVGYGDVSDAVTAAVPRVVNVRDLTRSVNGFGYRLSLGLETDSAEPFTAEELDAVVEAIWGALPWEPNTVEITAGADTAQGHEVVDLRAAAAELEPLSVTNAGKGGVGLTGMQVRYGAWEAPD